MMHKLLISTILFLTACGPSRVIEKKRLDLDPEVEAEVKRINLERYAGSWLIQRGQGSIYLEISEDGFYWARRNKKNAGMSSDHGSIDHFVPGKMILYSARQECPGHGYGDWLIMEQSTESILLRSRSDEGPAMPLQKVSQEEKVLDLPCP